MLTHYYAAGVEVVVQCFAFSQKLRAEYDLVGVQLLAQLFGVAHRDGAFDDHSCVGVNGQYVPRHCFNRLGIEVVGFRVVIGGGGNNHKACAHISFFFIRGGFEVKRFVGQEIFYFRIVNGRLFLVQQINLGLNNVQGHHLIVLGQQHGVA